MEKCFLSAECNPPPWIPDSKYAPMDVIMLIDQWLINSFRIILELILSVQFGAFLILIGSIIYPPTGSRIGKYSLLLGLIIFTINQFSTLV